MRALQFVTDFADQAVVLPVVLAVLAALALGRRWRAARAWVLAVGATLAATLAAKLAVAACGPGLLPALGGLRSPSGHTASAAVVYGGIAVLALRGRLPALALAAGLAAIIAATRLGLHVHTVPDVVSGAVIGVAGAVALQLQIAARPQAVPGPQVETGLRWRLLATALAAAVLMHGQRVDAEAAIHRVASQLASALLGHALKPACSA